MAELPTQRESPLFSEFCRLLESVLARSGTDQKKQRLEKYLQNWRSNTKYGNFFDAMRLLLPHLDKERTTYGMKEQVLARTYIDVLGIGKDSQDAQDLIHWRIPGKTKAKTSGDFASVAYEVIAPRSAITRDIKTIADVNKQLDLLNVSSGKEAQRDIIRHFFTNYTAEEQKWIIRIILKELKIGISENSVLNVFHPDASNLFNVCSNLRKVCTDLRDPFKRLATNDIAVFHALKPQLAYRELPNDVFKTMGKGNSETVFIEQKLDGERMQLHFSEGEYRYWSRKTTDYTHLYGANKNEGTLTPYIHSLFHHNARSFILDGEMIAYDPMTERFEPFGNLKTAAKDLSNDGNKVRPCFVAFDIVLLNGIPIIDQPLSARRQVLIRTIVKPKPGYLQILPHTEARTTADIIDALDKSVMNHEEGIIIKNPQSVYAPGQRNPDWIKIKPEYVDSLGDDVDVLIIGGIWGSGRRRNQLSNFMCAVRDHQPPAGQEQKYLTFCKVGTGYSFSEIAEINKLLEKYTTYNRYKPPSWLVHPINSTEQPDVIIRPEDSLVIQIRASEITASIQYASGYTLRFPRFVKVRPDKSYLDCMSISELLNLRLLAAGRLQSRKLGDGDLSSLSKKRKKAATGRNIVSYYLAPSLMGADTSKVEKKSGLFDDMHFNVISGDDKYTKNDLELLIKSHGGNLYQDESAVSNMRVIAGNSKIPTVYALIKRGTMDIIRSKWLLDCIERSDILPLNPKYMLFATENTKAQFAKILDKFGDSFTDEITDIGLRELFSEIPITSSENLPEEKRRRLTEQVEERYLGEMRLPSGIFQRKIVFLDYPSVRPRADTIEWATEQNICDHFDQISCFLRFHGAQIVTDAAQAGVTHIIFNEKDLSRLNDFRELFRGRSLLPRLVRLDWVTDSIEEGILLDENTYQLR